MLDFQIEKFEKVILHASYLQCFYFTNLQYIFLGKLTCKS